jgi:tRNA (guanine37-N1)-methyltransferase
VLAASKANKVFEVRPVVLRVFAVDLHGSVDDHPYGGGDGMVLRPEPLAAAVEAVTESEGRAPTVILTSPAGTPWTHVEAERFAADAAPLLFVAGRFGGVDQRFVDQFVHHEYSVGDVVLAGGELPALMMAESILRFLPGVLGHADSAALDSFSPALDGGLEHPLYTRPLEFRGARVPDVLLSGDHERIATWRRDAARSRTADRRPDLKKRP